MRASLAIAVLVTLAVLTIPTASAASVPKATVGISKMSIAIEYAPMPMSVELGQKIYLDVKVGVHYESPVSLDGFWLKVWFKKPNGVQTTPEWFDFRNQWVSRGSERTFTVKTNVVADQEGVWIAYVELYTKDKSYKLGSDQKSFRVTKVYPAAYTSIENIGGYVAAALGGGAVLGYIISRKF